MWQIPASVFFFVSIWSIFCIQLLEIASSCSSSSFSWQLQAPLWFSLYLKRWTKSIYPLWIFVTHAYWWRRMKEEREKKSRKILLSEIFYATHIASSSVRGETFPLGSLLSVKWKKSFLTLIQFQVFSTWFRDVLHCVTLSRHGRLFYLTEKSIFFFYRMIAPPVINNQCFTVEIICAKSLQIHLFSEFYRTLSKITKSRLHYN